MTIPEQEITLARTILAPPPEVYAAFATAEGWCAWCSETAEVDARVGGKYHLCTQGYNARGEFIQLDPGRSLAFTWDGDEEPPMRVRVLLDGQGQGTILTFTVAVLGSLDAWPGFVDFLERTWGRVLDNLKAVLEAQRRMIRIRGATADDGAGLARVQVDSYRAAYAGLLPAEYLAGFSYEEQERDWRGWLASHPEDVLLVAVEEGGEVVGYALARAGASSIVPYDGELVALHVRGRLQRQGLGRRLVAAAAGALRQRGCTALMVWVMEGNPSRGFYERLGGRLIGRQTVTLDEGVTAVEVAYGWPDIEEPSLSAAAPDDWAGE